MNARKFLFSNGKTKEAPKIRTFGRKLRKAIRNTFGSTSPHTRRHGPRLSKTDLAASLFVAPQPVGVHARSHGMRRRRPLAYASQVRGQDIFRVR